MSENGYLDAGRADLKKKKAFYSEKTFKRRFFLCSGFLAIGVGLLGMVLPILDTTPFVLLGAYCFAKSSPKWHRWVLRHPVLGVYIAAFQEKGGLTVKQKWRIALTTTAMLSITAFLHGALPGMQWVLGSIWIACMSFLYFSRTPTTESASASPSMEGGTR